MTYQEYREQLYREFEKADDWILKMTERVPDIDSDGSIIGVTNLEATRKREKALNDLLKLRWHVVANKINLNNEVPANIYELLICN